MKRKLQITAVLIAALSFTIFAQTAGTLTFKFTEIPHIAAETYSGNAQHALAVWIQSGATGNATSTFVKTRLRYGANSSGSNTRDHLDTWAVNSGGTAANANATACNKIDATTGATLAAWQTNRTITWDGKNANAVTANETIVADGTYRVTIESCWDHDWSGAPVGTGVSSFTFTKGPNAVHLTPTATINFTNMTLDWVPLGTGVNEVSSENPEISVYPNPTNGIFNVDFKKADNINVVNMLGSVIFEEKVEQIVSGTKTIDLTNFANGIYFIQVLDGEKIARRKIILNK